MLLPLNHAIALVTLTAHYFSPFIRVYVRIASGALGYPPAHERPEHDAKGIAS
jgi:hypothetical protein